MFRYGVPLVAVGMFMFAVVSVISARPPRPQAEPPSAPPVSPFSQRVAGLGLVEASSENISIGAHVSGVVQRVAVRVGDLVQAGGVLFELDGREERAALQARQAELEVAQRRLTELMSYPRPEERASAVARRDAAQATVAQETAVLADRQRKLEFFQAAQRRLASTRDELRQAQYAFESQQARLEAARAGLAEAEAQLALTAAGTFAPLVETARSEVQSADAHVALATVALEKRTVRAPISGRVLRVDVRVGEFAAAGELADPLMVLGADEWLHVRVDIDEVDAPRVTPGAPAVAMIRGRPEQAAPLEYVRTEPLMLPKRALNGAAGERVDTRVLQAIYRLNPADLPVYIGQQLDVFIDASQDGSARALRQPATQTNGLSVARLSD